LESAVRDEEESPEGVESERVGLLLRIKEERCLKTVLVLEER
jgi:hypothetical protein